MMKLTPWFPSYVNPTRIGVYEVRLAWVGLRGGATGGFAHWSGLHWGCYAESAERAADHEMANASYERHFVWRGVAK